MAMGFIPGGLMTLAKLSSGIPAVVLLAGAAGLVCHQAAPHADDPAAVPRRADPVHDVGDCVRHAVAAAAGGLPHVRTDARGTFPAVHAAQEWRAETSVEPQRPV